MPARKHATTVHIPTLAVPSNKPYGVSYSKMASFRRCLQSFHWKYMNKYFTPSSMGQQRGTSGHAALAVWHVGYDRKEAIEAAWDSWSGAGYADNEDWQLLYAALLRYFDWSASHDTFVLKVAEQKFDVEYDLDGVPVILTGYMDGIVEEDGRLWVLENKFLKRMDNNDTSLDMQVSTYMLAAQLLKYDVSGVIYNKVRISDSKVAVTEPVVRTRMFRNPQGLDRVQNEMIQQMRQMIFYEKGGGVPYRNPTKDCSWDCAFYQACLSMQDDGQDPTELLKMIASTRSTDNA